MSWQAIAQATVLVVLLVVTVPLLGRYMADVYGARKDGSAPGDRIFGPVERLIYRVCRIDAKGEQRWNVYTISLIAFSVVSFLVVYGLERPRILTMDRARCPATADHGRGPDASSTLSYSRPATVDLSR